MRRIYSLLFTVAFCSVGQLQAQQRLDGDGTYKRQPGKARNARPISTSPLQQRPATAGRGTHCGFAAYLEKAKSKGYNEATYEQAMRGLIQRRLQSNTPAFTGPVTIPVIFHVIYRTGQAVSNSTPNLTAAKFQAQINQMNADYANTSGSAYGVAADVQIRFCLAVVDTAGRPLTEPGIDRINGTTRGWTNTGTMDDVTTMDYFDNTIKPASIWDPYSYMNVWTADMNTSGLLGYSTFPSFSTLDGLDNFESSSTAGCVINYVSIGSVSSPGLDANYGFGRTLTHESGHFFGLRHIWGDATCGDDYCTDTPPQDAETTGCPATGTLNNCTPSGPKMFENYMDYTDDACVNTFTAEQALRCQTAIDNSPRRASLINSKACVARAGNAIGFSTAAQYLTSETGTAGTCPNGRSYSFKLYVSSMATGAATVTFAATGSTATLGTDFTISPSTVTYAANDNAVKTVTITVTDDQVVEPLEMIKLSYTISGTGVVAGPDKQSITLYVSDDDVAGVSVNNTTPTASLISQNFNASTSIPAGWSTQVYDDGSASYTPNQWVVSANGGTGTTGNAAHITRNVSTKPNTYANTNISDAYLYTPLLDATGARDLVLSFKWRCLGEVGYDEGYIGYIPEGLAASGENVTYFNVLYSGLAAATAAQTATINLPPSLSNTRFRIVFNWFNDETIGSNPPFTVDDITLTGRYFSVASSTDADTAFAQFAGQTVNYYSKSSTTNRLIATVSNLSENIGCINASVPYAGTGKTTLLTTSGSYFRTDKVIKLTPATANTTATYQVTLYFTPAELSTAWTATEIQNLKLLKVKEGVDIFGTIGSADAELITPIFNDATGEGGYYSYTANCTGFSQFMLVSPNIVLPVTLLNFDAKAGRNSVAVNWSTSQEINSRNFVIERSSDGINFTAIGTVAAKGNSSNRVDYTFFDNFVQPGNTYYYRLRQYDADGRATVSSIRMVKLSKQAVSITVSPVPADNVLNLYIKGASATASVNLLNLQGQLVKKWQGVNTSNASVALNVADLPAGIYVLDVVLPGEKITRKVMIERK